MFVDFVVFVGHVCNIGAVLSMMRISGEFYILGKFYISYCIFKECWMRWLYWYMASRQFY